MTLNQIAEAIDVQIVRMQKVRAIVASLLPAKSSSTSLPRQRESLQLPVTAPLTESAIQPPAPEHRVERKPREPKLRKPRAPRVATHTRELPPTALGGSIPRGPVFVSAAEAVRSRHIVETAPAARPAATGSESGHSLDDLVLQLTGRSAPTLLHTQ